MKLKVKNHCHGNEHQHGFHGPQMFLIQNISDISVKVLIES